MCSEWQVNMDPVLLAIKTYSIVFASKRFFCPFSFVFGIMNQKSILSMAKKNTTGIYDERHNRCKLLVEKESKTHYRGLISITFIFRLFGSGKHCFMGSFTNAKI